jgi:hypothetical protein
MYHILYKYDDIDEAYTEIIIAGINMLSMYGSICSVCMDQQKEDHGKSVTDSNARMRGEGENWSKFHSTNKNETMYQGQKVVYGFFSQCEKCKMWVKVTRPEVLDYNAPLERQIPLNRTTDGEELCDRCWDETRPYDWISTLLKKHLINPSAAYADIETMYNDGYRHFEQIGLAGPISSGPWDDDLREHLDDVVESIGWRKNIFPREYKTEIDKRHWMCVGVARERHEDPSL